MAWVHLVHLAFHSLFVNGIHFFIAKYSGVLRRYSILFTQLADVLFEEMVSFVVF
jgi:hypothetical protein